MTALRSGEYAQTTDTLARRDEKTGAKSYCCEGVAFERYGKRLGYQIQWSDVLKRMVSITPEGARDTKVAPASFWRNMGMLNEDRQQFRFDLPDGLTLRDDVKCATVQYAELNDVGFTFDQIADLVEWQFLPPNV